MAGYLDQYGAGDERREKRTKTVVIAAVALLVVGGTLFFFLKNFRQERQVKHFFEALAKQDYHGAYRFWGCTEDKPCRDYQMGEFMKDWGPSSGRQQYSISKTRSCGSGVILTVTYPNHAEDKLWVEKDNLVIGFSPWPGCPAR